MDSAFCSAQSNANTKNADKRCDAAACEDNTTLTIFAAFLGSTWIGITVEVGWSWFNRTFVAAAGDGAGGGTGYCFNRR